MSQAPIIRCIIIIIIINNTSHFYHKKGKAGVKNLIYIYANGVAAVITYIY